MRLLDCGGIPTSLGDIINIKYHLDLVKNNYDQIRLSFHTPLWKGGLHTERPDWAQRKLLWEKYLSDIGRLFFSEKPYLLLSNGSQNFGGDAEVQVAKTGLRPQKAEMAHLLCQGYSLNLDEEYIVITTKIRYVERAFFRSISNQLFSVLRNLSKKYKIVVLGERVVEMRKEYIREQTRIFGIYDQIIANLPADRILDLTVPALGETVSDLRQIQQDCFIMNEAKFVITIGVGGNSCMAHSCARMVIGFRADTLPFGDVVFGREYPNMIVSKDFNYFIQNLEKYI